MSTLPSIAQWCRDRAHPWVTYNPQLDRSFCRCGSRQAAGEQPMDWRVKHEVFHRCPYETPCDGACYTQPGRTGEPDLFGQLAELVAFDDLAVPSPPGKVDTGTATTVIGVRNMPSKAGRKAAQALGTAHKAKTGRATVKTATPRSDAKVLKAAGSVVSALFRKLS